MRLPIPRLLRKTKLPNKPPVSLVLLLLRPRFLDAAMLARLASKALGVDIPSADVQKRAAFVSGKAPCFVLTIHERQFLVNNFPQPYPDDLDEAVERSGEPRLRKAVRDHHAWLSVDALGGVGESDRELVYGVLGKLTAALAMSDCLAIYAPEIGSLCLYDPALIDTLAGSRPLDMFQ